MIDLQTLDCVDGSGVEAIVTVMGRANSLGNRLVLNVKRANDTVASAIEPSHASPSEGELRRAQ